MIINNNLVRKSNFLAADIFSRHLIFWSETSTEQPLLLNRKFFRAVTFPNKYFFWWRNYLEERYLQKSLFFEARTSAHHQLLFRIFEKAKILENKYSALSAFSEKLFLGQLHVQKTLPTITATFS